MVGSGAVTLVPGYHRRVMSTSATPSPAARRHFYFGPQNLSGGLQRTISLRAGRVEVP